MLFPIKAGKVPRLFFCPLFYKQLSITDTLDKGLEKGMQRVTISRCNELL
ncbi:hypothetical protein HMPREF9134_00228 [Porphyromonas catoniae F0037]|uniref:Uncharacterized protein n=1 Tax=Porphyromonas catoniae F0037 TaxID=1127696 RepID=L1NHQ8_9PORP|nr:hypothetical protein HMPREF9134_00228 [Porphyromonas catoniae F0037]